MNSNKHLTKKFIKNLKYYIISVQKYLSTDIKYRQLRITPA